MKTVLNILAIIFTVLSVIFIVAIFGEPAPILFVFAIVSGLLALLFAHLRENWKRKQKVEKRFNAGDQVRLISGGPIMTVNSYETIGRGRVVCKWFSNNQVLRDTFDENSLQDSSEPQPSPQSDSVAAVDQVWKITLEGVELLKTFHPISKQGEFEVVIFNSMLFLAASDVVHHESRQKIMTQYFEFLNGQALNYNMDQAAHEIPEFINQRLKFYAKEIDNMSQSDNFGTAYYPPSKVYSAFFTTPLSSDLEEHPNIDEVISFGATLRVLRQQLIIVTKRFWTRL